jgi:Cdc6-like AAA superfamily ATPase
MTITNIKETINPNKEIQKPIKEKQDIFIPDIIDKNIPRRNGSIIIFTGSGGSGKTSLLLNMFKSNKQYRGKFHNIYYFCPMASFLSVNKHPPKTPKPL